MNKKMYRIKSRDRVLGDVEIVDIIKQTDKSVWKKTEVSGCWDRELKRSIRHAYVETEQEAVNVLLERAESKKAQCLRDFIKNKKILEENKAAIKQLKAELKGCDK